MFDVVVVVVDSFVVIAVVDDDVDVVVVDLLCIKLPPNKQVSRVAQ